MNIREGYVLFKLNEDDTIEVMMLNDDGVHYISTGDIKSVDMWGNPIPFKSYGEATAYVAKKIYDSKPKEKK